MSSYSKRTSSETSTSSYNSATSHGSYTDARHSTNSSPAPRVEVLRCSRCAMSVETIVRGRAGDGSRRVSSDEASASGMVKFGTNLYYCDRCANMVGYK